MADIRFILVRPKDSRNVGAVCRAMKNMGLKNLTIVMDRLIDPQAASVLAIHASDILEEAAVCTSLEEAVRGSSLIAGVTRRRGKRRKYFSLNPEEFAIKATSIEKGLVTVLFGNEAAGLSDEELSICHVAVGIPAHSEFPSLNLSHAVQIIAYEIFLAMNRKMESFYNPVENERLKSMVGIAMDNLRSIGFFKQVDGSDTERFFTDIFARAAMSEREVKQMEKIFKKIGGLASKNRKLP